MKEEVLFRNFFLKIFHLANDSGVNSNYKNEECRRQKREGSKIN